VTEYNTKFSQCFIFWNEYVKLHV